MFLVFESPSFERTAIRKIRLAGLGWIERCSSDQSIPGYHCRAEALPGKEKEFDLALYELLYCESVLIPRELNGQDYASRLEGLFHPNGAATLVTCAREFLYWHRDYEDPHVARGACDPISRSFQSLLLRRKVVTFDDLLSGRVAVEQIHYDGCFFHAWNRIGAIHIDWTFRQFNPDTPFPYIFHDRLSPRSKKAWHQSIDGMAWEMGF